MRKPGCNALISHRRPRGRSGAWNWGTVPLRISLQLQPVFRDLTVQAVAGTEIHVHMNITVFLVFLFRTKNYPGQYKCTLRAKFFAMRVAWPIVYSGQVWGKVKILGHAESFSPLFKTPEIVGRIYSFNSILVSETLKEERMPVKLTADLKIFILFNKTPVQTFAITWNQWTKKWSKKRTSAVQKGWIILHREIFATFLQHQKTSIQLVVGDHVIYLYYFKAIPPTIALKNASMADD